MAFIQITFQILICLISFSGTFAFPRSLMHFLGVYVDFHTTYEKVRCCKSWWKNRISVRVIKGRKWTNQRRHHRKYTKRTWVHRKCFETENKPPGTDNCLTEQNGNLLLSRIYDLLCWSIMINNIFYYFSAFKNVAGVTNNCQIFLHWLHTRGLMKFAAIISSHVI